MATVSIGNMPPGWRSDGSPEPAIVVREATAEDRERTRRRRRSTDFAAQDKIEEEASRDEESILSDRALLALGDLGGQAMSGQIADVMRLPRERVTAMLTAMRLRGLLRYEIEPGRPMVWRRSERGIARAWALSKVAERFREDGGRVDTRHG